MATATGNITLASNVTGGVDGARSFGPITITANNAVTQTTTVTLAVGANTITVPSGATAAVLLPPNTTTSSSFGGVLTVKGVSGDTGIAVSNKWPTLFGFDTAPSTFVVNSTAVGSLVVWFM
jgi:hypothetical protein